MEEILKNYKSVLTYFYKNLFKLISFSALLIILTACGGGGVSVEEGGGGSGNASGNSATLTWEAPTTNVDGTPINDLAGFKIYYGTSSGNYTQAVDAGNATTYTFNNLSPGMYYFTVTAYDTSGYESGFSNEVSKALQN